MNAFARSTFAAVLTWGCATAETISYSNYIRQYQMPSQVSWDASSSVPPNGSQPSALPINPGGARFELWTIKSSSISGLTEYPLDSSYVGTYVPVATVTIRSEDTTSAIRRTRADRPFYVDIMVGGLRSGETDPEASKKVKFLRHVQSYGSGGTGENLDRGQATLFSQTFRTENKTETLTFALSSVPGGNRSKLRGEERFSIFSLEDFQAPESQLSSQFIQIWPVADATISGITQNQAIRFSLPAVTLVFNDLYPSSTTYAQVYPGDQVLGTTGTIVPGSALVVSDSIPQSRTLSLTNYGDVFDRDGRWTMEIVTKTPFGLDRLAWVSFTLNRTIKVNGSFTTITTN